MPREASKRERLFSRRTGEGKGKFLPVFIKTLLVLLSWSTLYNNINRFFFNAAKIKARKNPKRS